MALWCADSSLANQWPFLLIVRTVRIFTAGRSFHQERCDRRVPTDTRSFQHLASSTTEIALVRGSTRTRRRVIYLRHFCYYSVDAGNFTISSLERPGHFCLAPHVAMRVGLYLRP